MGVVVLVSVAVMVDKVDKVGKVLVVMVAMGIVLELGVFSKLLLVQFRTGSASVGPSQASCSPMVVT